GLGNFTQTYFMGYVGRSIVKRLRSEVFASLLDLPAAYFDRSSAGTLLSKLTYNSEQVGQASSDSIVIMVRAALTVMWMIAGLFWFNWQLALISLAIGPVAAWLVSIVNRNFRRYGRRIQDSMGDVTRIAKESFEAPRLVKVHEAHSHPRSRQPDRAARLGAGRRLRSGARASRHHRRAHDTGRSAWIFRRAHQHRAAVA